MAIPIQDSYSVASGLSVYGGRSAPSITEAFDAVQVLFDGPGIPAGTENFLVLELHGSAGQNTTTGRQYSAGVSGRMAYDTYNTFRFSVVRSTLPNTVLVRPIDEYGVYTNAARRESMWLGFKDMPTADVALITQRRLDALLKWTDANITYVTPRKLCLTGGSMGGWGTLTFGIRRASRFAALYPDRPRWRYNSTIGNVAVADWTGVIDSVPVSKAPNLTPADGGGSVAALMDITSYVSNTANKIPWIGWCVGRQDGYVNFQDHIDAVAAMRSAKRGFAFAWNNGDHSTGSIISQIRDSYPYGTFEIGVGYPLFTNHSGDANPAVDLVGGINVGLSFRNVVESTGTWSCEVTSKLGANTVDVEPISKVFTATVAPQTISIPAANTWVPVSFSV